MQNGVALTISQTSPDFYVSAFSPFPTVFSSTLVNFLSFSSNLKLSFANCKLFPFGIVKNLSFGKGLTKPPPHFCQSMAKQYHQQNDVNQEVGARIDYVEGICWKVGDILWVYKIHDKIERKHSYFFPPGRFVVFPAFSAKAAILDPLVGDKYTIHC